MIRYLAAGACGGVLAVAGVAAWFAWYMRDVYR